MNSNVHANSGTVYGDQTKTRPEDRMDTQIVAVFCLCDDMLKALHHLEDPQSQISDAEVMTTAIVAALHFGGNLEKARTHMQEYGWIRASDVEQEPLQSALASSGRFVLDPVQSAGGNLERTQCWFDLHHRQLPGSGL
jgi:hypothetical protein